MPGLWKICGLCVALLLALTLAGCLSPDACPPGWVMNATGDCVDPGRQPDADGDRVLDPCPDGWVLAPSGFCEKVADGDDPDGDRPDGDKPADGDSSDGDDIPNDGDDPIEYRTCQADGECRVGELCQFRDADGGICLARCALTSYCRVFFEDSYCANSQRCEFGSPPGECVEDLPCEIDTVCHRSANEGAGACYTSCTKDGDCDPLFGDSGGPYYCSGEDRCEAGEASDTCTEDRECRSGTVCHAEVEEGSCLAPCLYSSYCQNYAADYICNTARRCIAPREDCLDDFDCEINNVCHTDFAYCMGSCMTDEFCASLGSNLWCNGEGRCAYRKSGLSCTDRRDCRYGQVCHSDADADGVCAEPCSDTRDCTDRIGPGLFCNAFNLCVPGDDTDGDIDPPVDGDQDTVDGDQDEELPPSECARVAPGGIYTLDIRTYLFRGIAKKGSQNFVDPYGKSAMYLRDNASGNMFKIYTDFSDGGTLSPVEVIAGSYNVWAENRFGQRKQVVNSVILNENKVIEVPFPFRKITVNLTRNGQPFPVLDSAYRGQLLLYDRSAQRNYTIGEVGGGQTGYTIDVFDGSYDIVFRGYLDEDPYAFQEARLITNAQISADENYNLDIAVVTIGGTINLGGSPPRDPDEDYGEVWLVHTSSGRRFPFWPISTLQGLSFSRPVIPGSYYIAHRPPRTDGNKYLWRNTASFVEWTQSAANVTITIPQVRVNGAVTNRGGALYTLYDEANAVYLDRGSIILKDDTTGETRTLVSLGAQGSVTADAWIGPGTYSYIFQGRLIKDNWFTTVSYPASVHQVTWRTGVAINANTSADIDLPIVTLSGALTANIAGVAVTDFNEATNDHITVRRAGSSQDMSIFRFFRLGSGGTYQALLFPGSYDMRYYGSKLFGRFQNNVVTQSFTVPNEGGTRNIAIQAAELGIVVRSGSSSTLADLISQGVFDSADIRVSNEITRFQASGPPDSSGRFAVVRPFGKIDLFLYIYKGDHYLVYPLQDAYDFTGAAEREYTMDFVTFAIQVRKNGQVMPNSANSFSRGSLAIRDLVDWRVDVRYDLGVTGESYGTFTARTGRYISNFTAGYGQVFPFLQYVNTGCLDVVKQ